MNYRIVFIVWIFASSYAWGQNVFHDLRSMEKRADLYYKEMCYATAIDMYKQLLVKPKYNNNRTIYLKIAKSYLKIGLTEDAETYYRLAFEKGFSAGALDSVQFAQLLMRNAKYEEAKRWAAAGESLQDNPSALLPFKSIQKIGRLYRDSFSFEVKPIIYNSSYADFCPVHYKNGVVFSSDRPVSNIVKQINLQKDAGYSSLYFFKERDSIKQGAQPIELKVKSTLHKGPLVFYEKGTKMIVTVNSSKGEVSRLQLFFAEWNEKKEEWENFTPFAYNSEYYSLAHPALSKDERTLYFVSDMPGGEGGTDIYVSTLKEGEWSKPKSLKEPINTEGNEMFPYISKQGKFYFASDGHEGLGGLDIFYLNSLNVQNTEILNPGYPFNSSGDDYGVLLDESERNGYFTSDRKGGKGSDDIYRISIKKIHLKLKVTDEVSSPHFTGPTVQLRDKELNEILPFESLSEKEGIYNYSLKPHHEYELSISKEDYKDAVKDISTQAMDESQSIDLKVVLKKKFEYYITLRVRDSETENIVRDANVYMLNTTSLELDSIISGAVEERDLKLDSDSDYLIFAYGKGMSGVSNVEKPGRKKVSSVRYVTLNVQPQHESIMKLKVLDSTGALIVKTIEFIWKDMITGEEKKIFSNEHGVLEFVAPTVSYFRIFYSDKKYFYDSVRKESSGTLKFK